MSSADHNVSCCQKEDLSDGENSESLSSVPDSEAGPPEPPAPAPDTRDKEVIPPHPRSSLGSSHSERSSHQPVPASGGLSPVLPVQPPHMARVKQPRGQGLTPPAPSQGLTGSKPLTSLANLSPTPKSLLTGLLDLSVINLVM